MKTEEENIHEAAQEITSLFNREFCNLNTLDQNIIKLILSQLYERGKLEQAIRSHELITEVFNT